jgi:hypothetical protein
MAVTSRRSLMQAHDQGCCGLVMGAMLGATVLALVLCCTAAVTAVDAGRLGVRCSPEGLGARVLQVAVPLLVHSASHSAHRRAGSVAALNSAITGFSRSGRARRLLQQAGEPGGRRHHMRMPHFRSHIFLHVHAAAFVHLRAAMVAAHMQSFPHIA